MELQPLRDRRLTLSEEGSSSLRPRYAYSIRDNYFGSENMNYEDAFNAFLGVAGTDGTRASVLDPDTIALIRESAIHRPLMKDFCQLGYDMNREGHVRFMHIGTDNYNDDNNTLYEVEYRLSIEFPHDLIFTPSTYSRKNTVDIGLADAHYPGFVSGRHGQELVRLIKSLFEHGPTINRGVGGAADGGGTTAFRWHTMNFLVPVIGHNYIGTQPATTTEEYARNQQSRLFPRMPELWSPRFFPTERSQRTTLPN